MRVRILSSMLLVLLAAPPANAQGSTSEPVTDASARIQELVQNLGSTEFSSRQTATTELLKLDAASVGMLELELEAAAQNSAGGETVSRLRAIVTQLRRRLFDDRLEALARKPSVNTAAALPEWERFSAIVGTEPDAIHVFVEVLQAEPALFATRLFAPKDLPAILEKRSKAFSAMCNGRKQEAFPIVTCVALMLLASDSDTRLVRATSTNISDAFDDLRFMKLLKQSKQAKILQKITAAWMDRSGPELVLLLDRPLLFALQQELTVGRNIAHRVIESDSRNQTMYYALLCLGKLNDAADLAMIESLFDSNTKLWPPQGESVERLLPGRKVESSFSVQTRDVALAVAIHLRGRDPAEFGIEVTPSDETMFVISSMGFETDDARNAALEKYRRAFPEAATDDGPKK